MHLHTREIILSMNVSFYEDSFPFTSHNATTFTTPTKILDYNIPFFDTPHDSTEPLTNKPDTQPQALTSDISEIPTNTTRQVSPIPHQTLTPTHHQPLTPTQNFPQPTNDQTLTTIQNYTPFITSKISNSVMHRPKIFEEFFCNNPISSPHTKPIHTPYPIQPYRSYSHLPLPQITTSSPLHLKVNQLISNKPLNMNVGTKLC